MGVLRDMVVDLARRRISNGRKLSKPPLTACRYCMRVSNVRMELIPVVLSTKVLSASA